MAEEQGLGEFVQIIGTFLKVATGVVTWTALSASRGAVAPAPASIVETAEPLSLAISERRAIFEQGNDSLVLPIAATFSAVTNAKSLYVVTETEAGEAVTTFQSDSYDVFYCDWRGCHMALVLLSGPKKWLLHATNIQPGSGRYRKLAGDGPDEYAPGNGASPDDSTSALVLTPLVQGIDSARVKKLVSRRYITAPYLQHLLLKAVSLPIAGSCWKFADKFWGWLTDETRGQDVKTFHLSWNGGKLRDTGASHFSNHSETRRTAKGDSFGGNATPSLTCRLDETQYQRLAKNHCEVNCYFDKACFGPLVGLFGIDNADVFQGEDYNVYAVEWRAGVCGGFKKHFGLLLVSAQGWPWDGPSWILHATKFRPGQAYVKLAGPYPASRINPTQSEHIYGLVLEPLSVALLPGDALITKRIKSKTFVTTAYLVHLMLRSQHAFSGRILFNECHHFAERWFEYLLGVANCGGGTGPVLEWRARS